MLHWGLESKQIILGLPTTMWETGGLSVKFNKIYKGVFIFAVLSLFMDYLITQIGFTRLSPSFEGNYLIKNLMNWMNPYLASTTWFLVTLVMIIITYKLAAYCQKGKLYSGSLDDIGRHLQSDGSLSIRDRAIFIHVAALIIFLLIHLLGLFSWLNPLLKV